MIPALQNFRTYHLAVEFYQACKDARLSPGLKEQLIRAAESIVLNLAEGSAKPTFRDRIRLYNVALGSFREAQAALQLGGHHQLLTQYNKLGGSLYRLARPKSK